MTGEVIVIPEGEHSILGPSSAERWMNCPGSVLLPGPNPQTEYAAEGTAAHTLSEWARNEGKSAAHWKGTVLQVGEYQFKVGTAMIRGVDTFVDSVQCLPGVPIVEQRVDYGELVEGGFGTLDDARIEDNLCTVTDLKFGKGVQCFSKDNPQLKLYSIGLFLTLRWLFTFDKFVLRISQPRLRHFDEWEISLGSLLQWGYDVVRPAARVALTPGAPLKAGNWCKFCKAKNTCATRAAYKVSYERSPDSPEDAFVNLDADPKRSN